MAPIISVAALGKRYVLGPPQPYMSLRETLSSAARSFLKPSPRQSRETLWALRDVTFDVEAGEVLGLIGRNGAGKSTLLKILTRITEPTTGRGELRGRVGSLLEVGTGFHPELTGRENVFFNGAVLGMRLREIERKFDEIVAFAQIERFLDTPVKHYSSGMYMRLAFSVAAHLESEILLVDEVLAVGDAEFQRKCLGKMQEVAGRGRTVIFVSHNMAAVQRLCNRAILLDQGRIVESGAPTPVINTYLQSGTCHAGERVWASPSVSTGDDVVRLKSVRAVGADGRVRAEFSVTEPIDVAVEMWVLQGDYPLSVSLYFYDEAGVLVFMTGDFQDPHWQNMPRPQGIHRSTCHIPPHLLNEGTLSVLVGVSTDPHTLHALERDAITIRLLDNLSPGGARGAYTRDWPGGVVRPLFRWTFAFEAPIDGGR